MGFSGFINWQGGLSIITRREFIERIYGVRVLGIPVIFERVQTSSAFDLLAWSRPKARWCTGVQCRNTCLRLAWRFLSREAR